MTAAQRALQETRSSSKRTGQDRTGQDRTGQDRTGQDSFVNHSAKAEFRTSATPELAALCRFI